MAGGPGGSGLPGDGGCVTDRPIAVNGLLVLSVPFRGSRSGLGSRSADCSIWSGSGKNELRYCGEALDAAIDFAVAIMQGSSQPIRAASSADSDSQRSSARPLGRELRFTE
jgi:hypothetical protein